MNWKNLFAIFIILFIAVLLLFYKPNQFSNQRSSDLALIPVEKSQVELKKEVIKEGEGEREAKIGDKLKVHYTGTLENGTQFDSSLDRNTPFEFTVGQGVIEGWSQGVIGMKKGEKRILTIPGNLAYGANPPPGSTIPSNATLIFEIELIEFLN